MDERPYQRPAVKTAVALKYDRTRNRAPSVAATGRGRIAERILEVAKQSGVPVREDRELVELLARLDLGEAIPAELYPVIAEVFAFVYRLNAAPRGR